MLESRGPPNDDSLGEFGGEIWKNLYLGVFGGRNFGGNLHRRERMNPTSEEEICKVRYMDVFGGRSLQIKFILRFSE